MDATQLINEFRLVEQGHVTYQDLGYSTWDGAVPAFKMQHHLFIYRVITREREASKP